VKQRWLHEQDRCRRLQALQTVVKDCSLLSPEELQTINEAVSDLPSFKRKHYSTLVWLCDQESNLKITSLSKTRTPNETLIRQKYSVWVAIRLAAAYADYKTFRERINLNATRLSLEEDTNDKDVENDDQLSIQTPQQERDRIDMKK